MDELVDGWMGGWTDGLMGISFLYCFSLGSEHIYTNTGSRRKKLLAILSGIFFLIGLAHLQVGTVTVCDHCLIEFLGKRPLSHTLVQIQL